MENMQKREEAALCELLSVVRRLRGEGGCPWDRAQTHETLRRYLIEETYEVLEALDAGDFVGLREELGDLLLQILFHAELAREAGHFEFADVVGDECDKMVRRHPHVFGDATAEEALADWEAGKSREKGRRTLSDRLASVPHALPALLRTHKYMEKCAAENENYLPPRKVREEILSLSGVSSAQDPTRAAGDFLLAAVAAFHDAGIECEGALTLAADRFFEDVKNTEKPL